MDARTVAGLLGVWSGGKGSLQQKLTQALMDAVRQGGFATEVRRMAANLRRYEQRQPCREPWSKDDVVHSPGPPVDPSLLAPAAP